MPIDHRRFTQDPKPLTQEVEQFRKDSFRYYFGNNFFECIGLESDRDRKGRDQDGNLRVYEVSEDGELLDPFAGGDTLTSDSFFDKINQGKIIAFPSGQKKPVQIQTEGNNVAFSVPLDGLPLSEPQPPAPKPLTGWQKFARAVTFGLAYRGAKAEYEQRVAALQAWQEKRTASLNKLMEQRTPEVLDKEQARFEADKARREKAAREAAEAAEREKSAKQVEELRKGEFRYAVDRYRSLYQAYCGPEPERRENLVGEGKSFTDAEFDVLKTYKLPKGPNLKGVEITDKEFAALSILNASSEKHGGTYLADEIPGMPPSEVAVMRTMMYTESMIDSPDAPRINMGQVLQDVYQPSRQEVFQAVNEYRVDGKRENLAALIAKGMNFFQHSFEGKPIGDPRNLTTAALVSESAALLDRDPKLKQAVLAVEDREGNKLVTQDDLTVAKGFVKVLELTRRNEKAQIMLHAESVGAAQLTDRERQGYIKDRLAFETVQYTSRLNIAAQTKSQEYTDGEKQAEKSLQDALDLETQVGKQRDAAIMANKDPAEIQRLKDEFQTVFNERMRRFQGLDMYKATHIQAPKTVGVLGENGDNAVKDLMATHLSGAEKLSQLKGKKLEEALKGETLFAEDSPYRRESAKVKDTPERKVEKSALQKGATGIGNH